MAILASLAFPATSLAAAPYSKEQAVHGRTVYNQSCAACHGGKLQGGAGPALRGKKFSGSLSYGNMTASQLFDFMSKHMPKNEPGSLPEKAYWDVFAYMLCENGFKAGKTALDADSVGNVTLLPLPGKPAGACHSP
ncbi:c-type cytochrome [Zhengella mangrovi]|nr:cytochrome c [Zhengella mangrovi]